MKKIYIMGLMLFLLAACSSEQENVSRNVEGNTDVQGENLHLSDVLTGSYTGIYIEQYKDDEQIGEQIALFGEDFEQFLSLLQETTLIREPLPEERPVSKDYYYIIVDGDKDITTMFIEKENEKQLISLPANNIIPSGIRKATNDDILKYIKTIETAEE